MFDLSEGTPSKNQILCGQGHMGTFHVYKHTSETATYSDKKGGLTSLYQAILTLKSHNISAKNYYVAYIGDENQNILPEQVDFHPDKS